MRTALRGDDRDDGRLLSPDELAAWLGVPVTWVYAKAASSDLPHYKLGHYLRFDPREVNAYLGTQRRGPGTR
jgi:excisionase family DNA binding protein